MLGGLIERMNQINEFRTLRGSAVFAMFSDARLKKIRTLLNKYNLLQGQRLVVNDIANTFYMVLDGKLQV